MPLHVPAPLSKATIEAIWGATERTLSDPNSYKADVSALLTKIYFDTEVATVPIDVWAHVTRTLSDPNSYKADVSALLAKIYFDVELAKIKNRSGSTYDFERDSLEAAGDEIHHTTSVFPHDTNLTLTFTAHADANTWSSWAEIVDSEGNKFSDLITRAGHITAFLIEVCETKYKAFMFEVAYGDAKIPISHYRFIGGEATKLLPIQQVRIRSRNFPATEAIYYRMKCEEAGSKSCQLHIRYYLHRG